MHFTEDKECFVTLFDSKYLPMGMCLHQSLMEHAQPFHLWIVCMDDLAVTQLRQLNLPHVTLLPLAEVETDALLGVKPGRSRGEYCWTLTPFTPQFVFDREPAAQRVTYLDADLFFFDRPSILLEEFARSGKDVLITPHAYSPEYDQSETSGIFCVQFMSFRRTEGGLAVMRWWQERCVEWCFARFEDGKFGDQKYLDDWPQRFPDQVHVLRQVEKTWAPWNVRRFLAEDGAAKPVLYHFHSLKIQSPSRIHLYGGYRIGAGRWLYDRYLDAMIGVYGVLRQHRMPIPFIAPVVQRFQWLRNLKHWLLRTSTYHHMADHNR
ncbi:hypothetical protein [Herbaspirillum rhizosphaerae]|uniref:hypothetical protein n=1 Tax=Herbaspirillum rhizosphaerae TaxID=346179 RepID=UPI00067D18B0|nr:hypothetical protein [Herbaspirillum rhizosphaerae]